MSASPLISQSRVSRAHLFLLLLCILLFHISGYIGNEMATTTFSLTMAIVEQGRLSVDDYTAGARELAYRDGHFYSGMPPAQSFIAVPLYFVFRPAITLAADALAPRLAGFGAAVAYHLDEPFAVRRMLLLLLFTVFVAAPCAAATAIVVLDLAERMGARSGLMGALLLPVGTLWWTYGTEYGPRVMAGFLLLLPVWWILVRRDGASDRMQTAMAIICGVGLGLCVFIRYELIFPVLIVGPWLAWHLRWRRAAVMVAGGLLIAGLGAAYHDHCFGRPTANAYTVKIWDAEALEYQTGHSPEGRPRLIYGGRPHVVFNQAEWLGLRPENLALTLWAGRETLLHFSPFLILVPCGVWLLWSHGRGGRGVALLLMSIFASGLLVVVLMPNPGTMGTIGPRYLLWTLPTLVLLALPAWQRVPSLLKGALFVASFAPSYLAGMLAARTRHAWSFDQIADYGLTNYTLSRLQEAGVIHSPVVSTLVVLAFWAVIAFVFFRPGSRRYLIAHTEPMQEPATEAAQ